MTTNANLYVDQGIDYSVELNVFDSENSEIPIDTQTITCKAKKMYAAAPAFTVVVTIDTDDSDPNNLTLTIPAETTANLAPGKYRYDVVMDNGRTKSKLLEGLLILLPTISG